jgi:putative flippase GtrA
MRNLVKATITVVARRLHIGAQTPSAALRELLRCFMTFAAVGAVATACSYSLLILQVVSFHVQPIVASGFAFLGGATTSYALNSRVTFGDRTAQSKPLARFLTVAFVGLCLNTLFMAVLVKYFNLHYLFAQMIATALVLAWNFSGNSAWTFGSVNESN